MMDRINVERLLQQLRLTENELAQRLSVHTRTVRRWVEGATTPRGPARAALLHLQQFLHSTSSSSGLRIGICPEFADTILPVLAGSTGILARYEVMPIEFVPIPWERRAIEALQMGFLDGLLFNEYCAASYMRDTLLCGNFLGEPFVSGAPYIAFSLPSSVPRTELLSVLWHPQTIKIVPHADMDATMRLVREGCRRSGGELQALATQDDEAGWFRCSAGNGVRLFLHPPVFWGNVPIAYIGGQDQRALIELAQEQITDRTIVILVEPGHGFDVEFPDSLRTNRLISVGGAARKLDRVVDAVFEARRVVSGNEALRHDALTELIRWQHAYGSAAGAEFRDMKQEFGAALPRIRTFSAELGRWF